MTNHSHLGGGLYVGGLLVTRDEMSDLWETLKFEFACARSVRDLPRMEDIANREIRVRKALNDHARWTRCASVVM